MNVQNLTGFDAVNKSVDLMTATGQLDPLVTLNLMGTKTWQVPCRC
jgi:hypothetical protein